MQAVESSLSALLSSLPTRLADDSASLNAGVERTLLETKSQISSDSLKNQWEFALRKAIFDLAVRIR